MVLDLDGLPVEVHGHPPGSEWNGHYHQRMYHALVASCAETGDLLDGELHPGARHLGKVALKFALGVVDRVRGRLCGSVTVRLDAGFPEPGLLLGLESRGVPYIARIRKNEVLDRMAKPYLTQPLSRSPEEPPQVGFHEMIYQAETWDRARRVVLVVRERPGELFPDHFWLVEESEAAEWSRRPVNLSRGHGPPSCWNIDDLSNRPVYEPIQLNRQRLNGHRIWTARKCRAGSSYEHVV